MVRSIRRMLWGGFAALVLLIVFGLVANIIIIDAERRREFAVVQGSERLLDAARTMDDCIDTMVAASRGYVITHDGQFEQQYADAVREFNKNAQTAGQQAIDGRDQHAISQFKAFFLDIQRLTDAQIADVKRGVSPTTDVLELAKRRRDAPDYAGELIDRHRVEQLAKRRRDAPDYAGELIDRHRVEQNREQDALTSMRQSIILGLIIASVLVLVAVAFALQRIEAAMVESITRQVRRTEALIDGMAG